MQEYWNACPSLKVSLFNNTANGYYHLKPAKADIAQVIEKDPSYVSQNGRFSTLLNKWKAEIMPQMKAVGQGARPMELIAKWSESLLDKAKEHSGLVDAYDVYDVLLNYWADVMQDDCYMIANDGWTYPEVKALKSGKGDKKKAIMYDEIVCDLVPVSIVLAEYFTAETTKIAKLSFSIESLQQELSYLVESNTDVFRFNYDDEDDKPVNVKIADVKKAIKNAKTDGTTKEYLAILKLWESTYTKKEGYVSQWKQKRAELTEEVVAKYAALTEDEIKMLVVERKWLASVVGGCEALMQNVTHHITSDITSLAERYEVTLGTTEGKVNNLEQEVLRSLKELGFIL